MNIIEIIAQDVFDKVRSRFSNLEMGDENGAVTSDPKEARFFDFDFTLEGNNLGRVSISLNELGSLKVFYGQDITEDADSIATGIWYDFLKEMRFFAKRRMLRFDTRDITKGNLNKDDFQYLAQNGTKENSMNESSMYGGPKTSFRKLENTLLRIRHSKTVDENQKGARSRNINALFIENEAGERFKYPFVHLAGAKAMQRHVANGGRPYDDVGNEIIGMSEQIAQLTAFKRHVGNHDGMNEEVNEILERSQMKLENLRKTVDGISKQGFYQQWVESISPADDEGFVMDQATMEDYKSKFTVKNFKEDLAQYFPLIHKIMQETGEVDLESYVAPIEEVQESEEGELRQSDDFAQFEAWADEVVDPIDEAGSLYYYEKLADEVFALDPNLDTSGRADEVLNAAYPLMVRDLGKKGARYKLNYDEDFPSDFVSAYGELQRANKSVEEGMDPAVEQKVMKLFKDFDLEANGVGAYGDPDIKRAMQLVQAGKIEDAADVVAGEYFDQDGGEVSAINGMYTDLVQDLLYVTGAAGTESNDAEGMENEEPKPEKPNMREVAEVVKSFYDASTGKFPKGETGVITHIKKQFGDHAAQVAEQFVEQLAARGQQVEQQQLAAQQFEEIKRLAGLAK